MDLQRRRQSDGIERSISPTSLPTRRLRATSMGYVGEVSLKSPLSQDDEGGVWSNIFQSTYVTSLRNYLKKRARNDYILCCLPKKNPWRKRIKSLVNSKWFNWCISFLVVIHCFILTFYDPYVQMDYKARNKAFLYSTIVFELLYIIEAVLRIIAAGLVMHPLSYLRNLTNVIDVFVIVVYFIFLVKPDERAFEVLSAVASLRLIRVMLQFRAVCFLLRALLSSLQPLLYLAWMTFCVAMFFALIGVEIFSGELHGACFVEYKDDTGMAKKYQVNEFPCTNYSDLDGIHQCSNRSKCEVWKEGPHKGLVGFDNILTGLLTVFQCITLEGWTSILYLYESVYGTLFIWLYFIMLIAFGSIIMLNLLLGVLTTVFVGVSDQQEAQGHLRKLKEKHKIKEDLEGYQEWLRKGLESEDESVRLTRSKSLERRLSRYGSFESDSEHEIEEREEEEVTSDTKQSKWQPILRCNSKVRSMVSHVVRSNLFFWFMILIIFTNFVLLAADHYPVSPDISKTILIINYVFTSIYIVELILKLYSKGPKGYLSSKFNRLDICFTLINIVDILILVPANLLYFNVSAIVNACRAIRLITVFKFSKQWEGMKSIITAFSGVSIVIFSVTILLTTWIVSSALLGMRLFGTRLTVMNENYHPSFDTFYKAFLLVFQLTTTEDWHRVMYRTAESYEGLSYWFGMLIALYYVIIIIFGGFIIVNIFLAIAIDKLSEVKSVKEDTFQREEQREEQRRERVEQLNAIKNPAPSTMGLGHTLRHVLLFYSTNLEHQEQQRKRRKAKKTESEGLLDIPIVKTERSISLLPNLGSSAAVKRSSFGQSKAISDPVGNSRPESNDDVPPLETITPQRVSIKNPLGKFFKSVQFESKAAVELTEIDRRISCNQEEDTTGKVPNHGEYKHSSSFTSASTKLSMGDDIDSLTDDIDIQVITVQPPHDDTASHDDVSCDLSQIASTDNDISVARLNRQSSFEDIHHLSYPRNQRNSISRREHFKGLYTCKDKVMIALRWLYQYLGTIELDPRNEMKEIPAHSSFFILAPDNKVRVWCYNIAKSRPFRTISVTVTVLSSLVLALEIPVPVGNEIICNIQSTILFFDIFFFAWFILEFLLKAISLGVFIHKGSYFHGLMNIIDFFIILTTLVPLIFYFQGDSLEDYSCLSYGQVFVTIDSLRFLKVLRVLRPLRAVRVEGLHLVIKGLLSSLRQMSFAFFVGLLVLLIFSIIGVQLFKGRFFYCSDLVTLTKEKCRGNYLVYPSKDLSCPQMLTRTWKQWELHFDHIGYSFLSLYTMLTKEGWQDIMYHGFDSNSTNFEVGPFQEANQYSAVYFILFMIIVTFFLVNLLVGFVIVTFQQFDTKFRKDRNLDRNQINCLHFALTSKPRKRYTPTFTFHKKLFSFINSWIFEAIITIAIILNTIILAVYWHDADHDIRIKSREIIYYINAGFTLFFIFEAVFKLIILTPAHYFRSMQRSFEFLIVVGSILEIVLQKTLSQDEKWSFLHTFSAMRILRLIRITKKSKLIIWTVLRSLEIFPWVGVLLLVIFYTYALIGVQLFGQIEVAPIEESATKAIHQYNNFENFPQALLVMIRCFTGENWELIMLYARPHEQLSCINGTSLCGSEATFFFFPSFMFLSNIIVLNLFVAIIIANFDYFVRDKAILGSHDLIDFYPLWAKIDPSATGKIHHTDVIRIMRLVNPPLGWGKLCSQVICYRRMMQLNIPLDSDGMVTFNATLFAIVRRALHINTQGSTPNDNELRLTLENIFPNMTKKMLDNVLPERPERSTKEEYAALFIQHFWRHWKTKVYKQMESKFPHQKVQVLRRIPDMGPELLQRRLTAMNIGLSAQNSPGPSPYLLRSVTFDRTPSPSHSPSLLSPHTLSPKTSTVAPPPHHPSLLNFKKNSRLNVVNESPPNEQSENSHDELPHPSINNHYSAVSESDLFATPTGSIASLNATPTGSIGDIHLETTV